MIDTLLVPKRYGNYADTFRMLGLVKVIVDALDRISQTMLIQMSDEETHYRIKFQKAIDPDAIREITYYPPFFLVKGLKTSLEGIPTEIVPPIFYVDEETKNRKSYQKMRRELLSQTKNKQERDEVIQSLESPNEKTQNGSILVSLRHERNHNDLWKDTWTIKDRFGDFLFYTLRKFSENPVETDLDLPEQANAVKVYFPNTVQGVSRAKSDTNTVSSQKADWFDLWLIAIGFFEFAVSERIKITEGVYDWRVVALEPKDITLDSYKELLSDIRVYHCPSSGYGIARFDSELVLLTCIKLLKSHEAKSIGRQLSKREALRKSPNEFIGRFKGTHFNSKGQVYGVKDIFFLGLPYWICPENYSEIKEYIDVLSEHLAVIKTLSVEEGHSELLASYRDFITRTTIRQFFPFQRRYADYSVRRLAGGKYTRLFTKQGLDTMTKNDIEITKITRDPSFIKIARAINHATVYAGEIKTKEGSQRLEWDRNYGLAQLLGSQSGSKKDFILAITEFLGKYEAENLRLQERFLKQGKPLTRVWPKKEDLDRLLQIIEENDPALVANLLIAYGYASWSKETGKDDDTQSTEQSTGQSTGQSTEESTEE